MSVYVNGLEEMLVRLGMYDSGRGETGVCVCQWVRGAVNASGEDVTMVEV